VGRRSMAPMRSRSSRRSTIMSSAPGSSRNSLRWNPSGKVSRPVCWITRGPAKPIKAFGSPMLMSPSMARLAETPPVVGSVITEMNGNRASDRGLSDAVLIALGILEFQGILGFHLDGNLPIRPRIQEFQQPLAPADAHVMTALGADMEIALDFGAVQDGIARRTLGPKPLRHRACTALGLDAGRDDAFEPGHALESTKRLR